MSIKEKNVSLEGNGIFLSYQMLFLLIGGLISLGITISVWNSYDSEIQSNTEDIELLTKTIDEKYKLLDSRIEKRYDDAISKINSDYLIIERRVNNNNDRFKEWLKSHQDDIEKLKEETIKLKYSRSSK